MDKLNLSPWLKDTLERVLSTSAQVFLLVLLAKERDWFQVDNVEYALTVAAGAGLTALKAAIARRFGDPDTASLVKQ